MAGRSPLVRSLVGAGVGGGLVVLWWVVFSVAPGLFFNLATVDCWDQTGLGCALGEALISVIIGVTLVIIISVIIGGVVLHAIGVRPAWTVALVGPPLAWVLALLADSALKSVFGQSPGRLIVPAALAYGLATLLTTRRST